MRVKILFVCHGNICRSPMAAMVFRYLAQQRHVSGEFEVDSAALSNEEIGNGIYPPARRILVKHGVPCTEHRARQITPEDFETADLIIGMEWGHLKKLRALCPKELTSFLISAIILPFSALPPARFPSHPSGGPCAAPNLRSPA